MLTRFSVLEREFNLISVCVVYYDFVYISQCILYISGKSLTFHFSDPSNLCFEVHYG